MPNDFLAGYRQYDDPSLLLPGIRNFPGFDNWLAYTAGLIATNEQFILQHFQLLRSQEGTGNPRPAWLHRERSELEERAMRVLTFRFVIAQNPELAFLHFSSSAEDKAA